jgi:hypothetical protein
MSTGFGLHPASVPGIPLNNCADNNFPTDLKLARQVLLLHRLERHEYQRNEIVFAQICYEHEHRDRNEHLAHFSHEFSCRLISHFMQAGR